MKAIGFKNFRNFEEFPLLEFGKGVTFLVGQNNAGKSTLTKACWIMAENMPSCIKIHDSLEEFASIDFGKICHSYERALRIGADKEKMEFTVQAGYFTITYIVDGMVGDGQNTRGRVSQIRIYDKIDDCTWISDFEKLYATLEYNGKLLANIIRRDLDKRGEFDVALESQRMLNDEQELNKRFELISGEHPTLTKTEFREKLLSKVEQYQRYQEWIDDLSKDEKQRSINMINIEGIKNIEDIMPFKCDELDLIWIDENGKDVHDLQYKNPYMQDYRLKLTFDIYNKTKHDIKQGMLVFDVQSLFARICQDYKEAIRNKVIYLPAHETPQRSEFYTGGENLDYFETIVRDFYHGERLGQRKIWVSRCMKKLGIGKKLVLESQLGEVVGIFVEKEDETKLPLSDFGRGTVQIIMLLLNVAAKMPVLYFEPSFDGMLPDDFFMRFPGSGYEDEALRASLLREYTIIIEEPEQNLHPALQSKLADLFLDISKKFRCNVIVETHSEYMIRRSQVLVAKSGYKDQDEVDKKCPFKVYYFGENVYTDMYYRPDGKFENSFGSGFFDEASNLAFEIM